VTIETAGLLKR